MKLQHYTKMINIVNNVPTKTFYRGVNVYNKPQFGNIFWAKQRRDCKYSRVARIKSMISILCRSILYSAGLAVARGGIASAYQKRCPHILTTASRAVSRHMLHSSIRSSRLSSSPPAPAPSPLPVDALACGSLVSAILFCVFYPATLHLTLGIPQHL